MKLFHKYSILLLIALVMNTLPVYAQNNSPSKTAISRMEAFGIIDDYTEESGKATVTKAELADIFVRSLGYEITDTNSELKLSDVSKDNSYYSSIAQAVQLGIVTGDDSGMFYPNRAATAEEAAAMAVRTTGYSKVADNNGGYPTDYKSIAYSLGIFSGIQISENNLLTRDDMLILIDNMLDSDYAALDYDKSGLVFKTDKDQTFFEKHFDVTKQKVTIISVDTRGHKVTCTISEGEDKGKSQDYFADPDVDLGAVGGSAVIYTDDDGIIVYLEMRKDSRVIYDYISEVNRSDNFGAISVDSWKHVRFTNDNKEYKFDDEALIYYNDQKVSYEANSYIGCFAKVVMQDDLILRMDIYKLTEGGLLYRADEDQLRFSKGTSYENYWKGFKDADDLQIIIDGEPNKKMQDLKPDMVFDYWFGGYEKFVLVASSRAVNGVLQAFSADEITVNSEVYTINKEYGFYNFNVQNNSYEVGGNFSSTHGQPVSVFIDDNRTVRYIRIDTSKMRQNVFRGVLLKAYQDDDNEDKYLRIFLVDGEQKEETFKLKERLKSESIQFEYLKSVQSDVSGMGFLEFTVNKNNEITFVSNVKYFGYTKIHSDSFDEDFTGIANQYAGEATIFALMSIDGKFTVKPLDYQADLAWSKPVNGVTVISDFDVLNNPVPDYMMLTTGSDQIYQVSTATSVISELKWLEDDICDMTMINGERYVVSQEFVNLNRLKKNVLLSYHRNNTGKEPIIINEVRDLSGAESDWKTDTFTIGALSGFFKADDVLIRNDSIIQFSVDGQPTDVYMFNIDTDWNKFSVIEKIGKDFTLVRGADGVGSRVPDYIRSVNKYPVMNVQSGDKVWFHVMSDSPRRIDYIIYESKASFF